MGTGFSDKQRMNPPKIGSIITYRFQELTLDGVPRCVIENEKKRILIYWARVQYRFPSFVGEAVDKDEPKDADIPSRKEVEPEDELGD